MSTSQSILGLFSRKNKKPIVCVCQENGRVGIVLMKDFLEASKAYWKKYQNGDNEYADWRMDARTGNVISVPSDKVFIFYKDAFNFESSDDKNGFNSIIERCMAQRAVFEVYFTKDSAAGQKARRYLFGDTE